MADKFAGKSDFHVISRGLNMPQISYMGGVLKIFSTEKSDGFGRF
jgi:hypothetical protein